MVAAKTRAVPTAIVMGSLWLSACASVPKLPSPTPFGASASPSPGEAAPSVAAPSPIGAPSLPPSPKDLSPDATSTVEHLDGHAGASCSPDGVLCIGSVDGGLGLYRPADLEILGSFGGLLSTDVTEIEWSADGTIAALLADTGAIYLWSANGASPLLAPAAVREPAETRLLWSAGSSLLAIEEKDELGARSLSIAILSSDGTEIAFYVLPSKVTSEHWGICGWRNDSLISICDNYGGLYYYEASSGRFLFRWQEAPHTGSGDIEQPPMFSPDGHWVAINVQMGCIDNPRCAREYDLVDLKTGARHVLASASDSYIDFVTWASDSTKLYVISRPASATATSDPNTPFGLLAIDPVTRNVEVLFDQAVQAEFSPDLSWAFMLFPVRTETGRLGIMGGLWKVGTTTMLGRHRVSEEMLYLDPAWQDWFGSPSLVPIAWSTDGIRVAWGDSQGNIKVQSIRGADKVLAKGWIQNWEEWVECGTLSWSDSNNRLLAAYGSRTEEFPVR